MAEGGRRFGGSTKHVEDKTQLIQGSSLLPEDMPVQNVEEAGAPIGRKGLFTREEYEKWSTHGGPRLRGFSFIPVKELDSMSGRWLDVTNVNSNNAPLLRGLAVTYFYRSNMSKARILLLRVLESLPTDLEVLLMLAECACCLPDEGDETFNAALARLCGLVSATTNLSPQHIENWNEKLQEKGRFMGYILLEYAFCKGRETMDRQLNFSRKRLIYACLRKITQRLSSMEGKMLRVERLNNAITVLLNDLKDEVHGYHNEDSRKQKYVEALCCNCLSCFKIFAGKVDDGLSLANEGLALMDAAFRQEAEHRMLYGDLLLNKAITIYEKGNFEAFSPLASQANNIYEAMGDNQDEALKEKAIGVAWKAINRVKLAGMGLLGTG